MKKYWKMLVLLVILSGSQFFNRAVAQDKPFNEDFSSYQLGASPGSIKTNGVAIVAHPTGQEGKWLEVKNQATYKLNRLKPFPANFTLEFDVLAVAEEIKDIAPVCFGFVKDNATREHLSNAGAFVQLHYRDADAVNIGNYELKKETGTTFDLASTTNKPVHVKLVVNGTQMAVYLDDTKLAETELFTPKAAKYFYFSGPWQYDKGSKLFISNFKTTL
ncbi:hypothetical protein [Mucilaginibacter sp.]|uniref:hypothetical protein n=1 Tax=Mucilaginibacter sp. TaxID=1882438 RepID=UPI000CB673DC|nr:hypothetical protein [Mucilaginibacter sp.]PLW90659.1 MAG: hypothetical protein C0154_05210 [Mucilaginibacter sp.]PMP65421.1 MAG: hypothetical protein C0191_03665 [Mucilaginibacter sp.]HEK20831.1 hypothetical protein [Bacteroidota bacterium]